MASNITMFSDLARAMVTTNGGHRLLLNHQQLNVEPLNAPVLVKFVIDDRILKSGNIQATLEFSLEFNFITEDSKRDCAIEMKSGGSISEPIIINFINWREGLPSLYIPAPFITTDDVTLLNIASGGEISFDMNVNGVHGSSGVIVDLNLWYKDPSYVKPEPIQTPTDANSESSSSDSEGQQPDQNAAHLADPMNPPQDFQDLDEPPTEPLSDPIDLDEVSMVEPDGTADSDANADMASSGLPHGPETVSPTE